MTKLKCQLLAGMSDESAENEPAPNLWDLLENENGGDDIREKILTDLVQRTVDKLRREDDGEDLALCSTNSANYGICSIWNRAWAQERARGKVNRFPQTTQGKTFHFLTVPKALRALSTS